MTDTDAVVAELRATLSGAVIAAGDPEYDAARRVWNGMFDDRRPVAVLRCADEADVRRAVGVLADVEAPLAIRGGGHHIAGFGGCDGGFVIDLGRLRSAVADPEANRVRVGGGATLHEVDTAAAEFGQAVPVGVVSPTGVAGLTLSGGVGWQTRRYGYASDNLRRARVVTATGELLVASEDENADLLWGLRGGGGNFGVVTEFEFESHPVDQVLVTEAYHRVDGGEEIADLLRAYRDWSIGASDDHTAWIFIGPGGHHYQRLLPELVGELSVGILACSLDVSDAGRRYLGELERFGSPLLARTTAMRLVELQHLGDDNDAALAGMPRYMKGEMMRELTEETIVGVAARCTELPTERSVYEMGMLGGAMGRIGEMEAAVGMRDANYLGGFSIMGEPGEEIGAAIAWTRDAWPVLRSSSAGGGYLNFDGEASEERVYDSLSVERGDAKQRRLEALKHRFDPGNRFHVNHNIRPRP